VLVANDLITSLYVKEVESAIVGAFKRVGWPISTPSPSGGINGAGVRWLKLETSFTARRVATPATATYPD
jgi:hypothetical protein